MSYHLSPRFLNLFPPFYAYLTLLFCKMYLFKVLFAKLLIRKCFLWMAHYNYSIAHNVQCVFTPLPPWHFNVHSFPFFMHTHLALVVKSAFLHLHTTMDTNLLMWAITSVILFFHINPSLYVLCPNPELSDSRIGWLSQTGIYMLVCCTF